MRKLYWYISAYVRKHGLVFLLSLIGAVAVFSFFISNLADQLELKPTQYIGLIGGYTLNNLPESVAQQLSVGLTGVDEDGSVVPRLAERWTIEQEGTAYRFILKKDVRWQDGSIIKPEDISLELSDVETIITPRDIVFKLPAVFSPFPARVVEPLFKEGTLTRWFFWRKPTLIGIGANRIADYSLQGERLRQLLIEGEKQRFLYRFYLTEQDAVTAYKRGEVDVLPDLARRWDIMEWPNTKITETRAPDQYLAVFFNMNDPLFTKNVRQALAYSLTKPAEPVRAYGPISPNSWGYFAGGKSYELDQPRALERLLEELPAFPLDLTLTTTTIFATEAEQIKKEWETFGQEAFLQCQSNTKITDKTLCENLKIKVAIHISNFPDTADFQLLLVGQHSPDDPDQYEIWHSNQSKNFTGYKNARIDALLEKGRQTLEQKERVSIYQEFQQFFLEDPPAIFLEYLRSYRVERT